MIRRPPRSTHCISSAASDVYKRQLFVLLVGIRILLFRFLLGLLCLREVTLFVSVYVFAAFFGLATFVLFIIFFCSLAIYNSILLLSLIHICRCRRYAVCRSRWSPYH
eukprot:TRINITY_DN3780_c0_g1_i6.p1 TRINITY_DN3780_c0_g1~~TRINITY_DN3780_c0_g1_i6.p1  ORF type:complete len:116 (-),score=13.50 TRINITY_DN3780_c0_g1_i6:22-345(-)